MVTDNMKRPFRETHNMLPENLHARFSIWVISRLKLQLGHAWNQGMEFKMSNFHYSSTSMIKKKIPSLAFNSPCQIQAAAMVYITKPPSLILEEKISAS